MPAPVFKGATSPASDWSVATSPKTQPLTASNGELVIVLGGTQDSTTTISSIADSNADVYDLQSSNTTAGTCAGYAWTTVVGAPAPLSVTTGSLPSATEGTPYSQTLTAQGGTGAGYTWSISSAALPSWASLAASTGVISGTPNATGTTDFTVQVQDSGGNKASKPLGITVNTGGTNPVGPTGTWTLVFDDEFTGTSLNPANWTALNGATINGVTTTSSAVSVSGGYCNVGYAGAICSSNVGGFAGPSSGPVLAVGDCCEAYINFPGPSGDQTYNWPAWWASGANWPANGEEDIFEGYGNGVPSALNYHSPSGANNGPFPPGNWCNSFHTYTLVRGATSLQCWWDGTLVRTVTPSDAGGGQALLINQGNGNVDDTSAVILVKYVRMWTPG